MRVIYYGDKHPTAGTVTDRISHCERCTEGSFWHQINGKLPMSQLLEQTKATWSTWELVGEEVAPDHFKLTFETDVAINLIEIGEPLEWLKEHPETALNYNTNLKLYEVEETED